MSKEMKRLNYKMKCCRCGEEMNYIEDKEMEKLGFISMDCPNGCDGGYLIPYNNPKLLKEFILCIIEKKRLLRQ